MQFRLMGIQLQSKVNMGHTFSFDVSIVNNCWINTGAMAEYDRRYEEWKQDKQKKSWMTMRS